MVAVSDLPDWEGFMLPVLQVMADGRTRHRHEIGAAIADHLQLSAAERSETTSGQTRPRHLDRSAWAVTYLVRAGALDRPKRGHAVINDVGRKLLADNPSGITKAIISDLPTYVPFPSEVAGYVPRSKRSGAPSTVQQSTNAQSSLSPQERLDEAIESIEADLAGELLSRLRDNSPAFFEQAVVDLVVAMGYGGADTSAVVTQLSNDGGIDGVIDQDVLGLEKVYVQAKRYSASNSVQRPEVQSFVGALRGRQADRGVFFTTGSFSTGARDFASSIMDRIVLVDGERLARFMIKYHVGVQTQRTIDVVEIDEDFFE